MVDFFDVATKDEIAAICGDYALANIDSKRQSCEQNHDYNCKNLVYLYLRRGDKITAKKYFDLISNEGLKASLAEQLTVGSVNQEVF